VRGRGSEREGREGGGEGGGGEGRGGGGERGGGGGGGGAHSHLCQTGQIEAAFSTKPAVGANPQGGGRRPSGFACGEGEVQQLSAPSL